MSVSLYLEASRADGTRYRLGLRCNAPWVWVVAVLSRLF